MAEVYHVLHWQQLEVDLAAQLAAGLRENSRCYMAVNELHASPEMLLAASMADSLALLVWSKTADGQKGRNRPKSVQQALLGKSGAAKPAAFATAAEFDAARERILRGNAAK